MTDDPFRHHPELRGLIKDPSQSFFRTFNPADFDEVTETDETGFGWRYPDDVRNRMLSDFMDALPAGDLWVFAYGSLIWDPGAQFTEILKAFAPRHARRFILYETGARGSVEIPSVMAALDDGDGCHGVVLRLAADTLATELEHIWRREQVAPAYRAAMIEAETDQGLVSALAFMANHDHPDIRRDLTFEQQVTSLATATGTLGSNFEYIDKLKRQFDALGIKDTHVDELYHAARRKRCDLGIAD